MHLWANAQKKTNEAATDVSLTFKHALTQVNIEVTKEAGYTYTISKVELTGIKGSGTFTYAGVKRRDLDCRYRDKCLLCI